MDASQPVSPIFSTFSPAQTQKMVLSNGLKTEGSSLAATNHSWMPLGGYGKSSDKVGNFYSASGTAYSRTSFPPQISSIKPINTLTRESIFVDRCDATSTDLKIDYSSTKYKAPATVTSFPTTQNVTTFQGGLAGRYYPIEAGYWSSIKGSTAHHLFRSGPQKGYPHLH